MFACVSDCASNIQQSSRICEEGYTICADDPPVQQKAIQRIGAKALQIEKEREI